MTARAIGLRVGDLVVHPVSDGTFLARPSYFGAGISPAERADVFDRDGAAWLPIGCFLLRADDRVVLVDAGLGPELRPLPDDMLLVGGQLPTGLAGLGVDLADITDVICTHLHADHVGWLFDPHGAPVFPSATVWVGQGDVDHFVDGPGEMADHIRRGFQRNDSRVRHIRQDATVFPGVGLVLVPGHTPGSLYVEVTSGPDRLLLLGDAITCPVQLGEPTWHSFGDIDPDRAHQARQQLWRQLEADGTTGVGAHFPHLRPGRVRASRWTTA